MKLCLVIVLLGGLSVVNCRKHTLNLRNDLRRYFSVSTFGFFQGGSMAVEVNEISFAPTVDSRSSKFGFTLTRTVSNSVTPYLESHQDTCLLLDENLGIDDNINIVSFNVDTEKHKLIVNCSKNFNLKFGFIDHKRDPPAPMINSNQRNRRSLSELTSDTFLMLRKSRAVGSKEETQPKKESLPTVSSEESSTIKTVPLDKNVEIKKEPVAPEEIDDTKVLDTRMFSSCPLADIPITVDESLPGMKRYSFNFMVSIAEENQSGLYSLYFHNCANYVGTHAQPTALNLSMSITERNADTYLSAGEVPLPQLFFIMSITFFCLGCGWIYVLRSKKQETFKIHYLMGLLVFVKSLSLMFHGINYFFIARDGLHVEAWAIMYYITHLLKGALLFITIVLIGTGWAFIKHILSDKDKKIFMIVIPLQVLANVAEIIMEESEEGETQHNTWREVFILVDLLCCGAILFPVVWSIRHLQDASQTDGKAAVNLEKLKLFRHFYVMIVCYIYFTRIIVFLLKITVPFQYEWLDEFFREVATLVFFLVTGYKFRPTYSNPYFRLSTEDDCVEMDEVMTQTGITEQVHKMRRSQKGGNSSGKQESSHEYD